MTIRFTSHRALASYGHFIAAQVFGFSAGCRKNYETDAAAVTA